MQNVEYNQVNPAVIALVELGNKVGSTKVSGPTRQHIRRNIRQAFLKSKELSKKNATSAL